MKATRLSALIALGLASGVAMADVRVEGPIEFGVFESRYQDYQPGERVLTSSTQNILPTEQVPAKLGTKFGMRYKLVGKHENDIPLTLLYLTPGVTTPDGVRHDKFEVIQKMAPGAPQDVMAYEFTETHEVVPGEWRFLVFQGDRLLAEKSFDVR